MSQHSENYYRRFTRLRTDKSTARWPAAIRHRAPHKPFLLLAIMDLIAQSVIRANFIELNAGLMDTFDLYWTKVMGQERGGGPILPFYHLHSDGFWHLVSTPGMEHVLVAAVRQIRSIDQFQQLVLGAKLDDALFDLFLNEEERDSLRRVLIETYFAPDIRPQLIEVGQITAESFECSRGLLDRSRERFKLKEAPEVEQQYRAEARSAAFRRVVVDAYNHTCALCGVRIVTPEGRTAVAAAHVVPWSVSHNDDPRNGMALCGLHHWTFDQGIVSVGTGYQIEVSPTVPRDEKAVEPLLELATAMLHRPADPGLWPARDALEWHRKNIFRAELPPRLLR